MKEKTELLRIWLRNKGHAPADIKKALAFYKEKIESKAVVTDKDVESVAESAHKEICDTAVPHPVVIEKTIINEVHETIIHKISMKYALYGSFIGAFTALASVAGLLWWLYSMGVR